jgi:hypothetical protein
MSSSCCAGATVPACASAAVGSCGAVAGLSPAPANGATGSFGGVRVAMIVELRGQELSGTGRSRDCRTTL